MLVLTFQKKDIYDKILDGKYSVDFWKSPYAFLNTRFTEGYRKINKLVSNKLGLAESVKDACFWGWVQNPFLEFIKNPEDYVAIFVELPSKSMVFSLYDCFTDYCLENSENSDYIISKGNIKSNDCVQCSFKDLPRDSIRLAVDLNLLEGLNGSIESMYISTMLRVQWLCAYRGRKGIFFENSVQA